MANNQYLTFVALEDCVFTYTSYERLKMKYTIDGTNWVSISSNGTTPTIHSGETVSWCYDRNSDYNSKNVGSFSSTGRFNAEGDITSLCEGNELSSSGFSGMFGNCVTLVNANNLIFPSVIMNKYSGTSVNNYYYESMFEGCTSLITLPTLPSTKLEYACYRNMFKGCTSLTTIPSNYLPSQVMTKECYRGMFANCTSLVNVPNNLLHAPILASSCYQEMFKECSSMRFAPELSYGEKLDKPNTDTNIYKSMFEKCTSLEKIPVLNQNINGAYNYQYTFRGCTSLDHATVNTKGGQGMFENCTSLSAVTCLDETPNYEDTYGWLRNVQYRGVFFYADSASWRRDYSGIPSSWTAVPYGQHVYEKHLVYKKQYSIDGGFTWIDTNPLETYIDDEPIETYPTSEECMT